VSVLSSQLNQLLCKFRIVGFFCIAISCESP